MKGRISFRPVADIAPGGDNAVMGAVERAFQLALSCRTIDELRAKLQREGHTNVDSHLQGSLRRELKKLVMDQSRVSVR
jgi:hypothetical protein